MSVQRINTGVRMSDVVIHNNVVYLSGKTPTNPDADIFEQTKNVLATIDALLEKAGTNKGKLLRADIFLKDIGQWADMNTVWDAWVPADAAPARATVEAKMANPKFLVEIVVTAAL